MATIDKINVEGTDYDIDVPVGTGTDDENISLQNYTTYDTVIPL